MKAPRQRMPQPPRKPMALSCPVKQAYFLTQLPSLLVSCLPGSLCYLHLLIASYLRWYHHVGSKTWKWGNKSVRFACTVLHNQLLRTVGAESDHSSSCITWFRRYPPLLGWRRATLCGDICGLVGFESQQWLLWVDSTCRNITLEKMIKTREKWTNLKDIR